LRFLSARQIVAATGVLLWSARLGTFLFIRVLQVHDKVTHTCRQPTRNWSMGEWHAGHC
jgi:hypothetical protein